MTLQHFATTLDTLIAVYNDLLKHCQTPADFAELKSAILDHLNQLEREMPYVTRA